VRTRHRNPPNREQRRAGSRPGGYGRRILGDDDEPEPTGRTGRRRPWLAVGAAVLALVVGLAVGFVVGGGTSRDSSVATVETAPPSPPPTTAPGPDPSSSQACLAAGAAAGRVLQELEAAVAAIGALDPSMLRRILDRLQAVQRDLQDAVAACGSGRG
jgi:hypothetical protein